MAKVTASEIERLQEKLDVMRETEEVPPKKTKRVHRLSMSDRWTAFQTMLDSKEIVPKEIIRTVLYYCNLAKMEIERNQEGRKSPYLVQ